jgi:hypothetical protein
MVLYISFSLSIQAKWSSGASGRLVERYRLQWLGRRHASKVGLIKVELTIEKIRPWPSVYERSHSPEVDLKGRSSIVSSLHHSNNLFLLVLSSTLVSFLCYMLHHSRLSCPATPRDCDVGDAILCQNGSAGIGGRWEGEVGRVLCTGHYIVLSLFECGMNHLLC